MTQYIFHTAEALSISEQPFLTEFMIAPYLKLNPVHCVTAVKQQTATASQLLSLMPTV